MIFLILSSSLPDIPVAHPIFPDFPYDYPIPMKVSVPALALLA
jgi:hypothetical protein